MKGENKSICGERRNSLKRQIVEHDLVMENFAKLDEFEVHLRSMLQSAGADKVGYLHDIRSSVSTVLSCCESVISLTPGYNFSEKIQNASEDVRSLYQSINLLNEQLDLADIIINPDAITYGPKSWSSIHGFMYKMAKIFEPRAKTIRNTITLKGGTSAEILAYNSFQFIPLILLDNAIKYSWKNRDVYINLREETGGLVVRFSSYGEVVPYEYREKIFEKYVRAPNALRKQSHGMGLGLHIARMIAVSHGFEIYYESTAVEDDIGNNDFVLRIPGVAMR